MSESVPQGLAWRLDYAWRVLATGISFALFGVVALVAGLTLFPAVCLTARDRATARRRAQGLTHRWFRLFSRFMALLGAIQYEIRGEERLHVPGRLIVANHPSLIDVVLLLGYLPEVDCIIKKAIFDNPFMKWPARWSGYISQASPEQLIEDCSVSLRNRRSLLVFPEGTRSVPGQPIRMAHGAARMALEGRCTILPVAIHCTPPHLFKHQPWYRVPVQRPHYVLEVGEPYPADRFLAESGGVPSVAARRLTRHWEQYFAARTGAQPAHPLANPSAQPQYSP